jgi:hypothetical protein
MWQVAWLSDSRHFAWGNLVLDLAGRVTRQLPIPENSRLIAVRPDGDGLLLLTRNPVPRDPLSSEVQEFEPALVELTDAAGEVVQRVRLQCLVPVPRQTPPPAAGPRTGPPDPPNPSPYANCVHETVPSVLGWRGVDAVLVQTYNDQWYGSGPLRIDAVRPLHRHRANAVPGAPQRQNP